MPQDDAKSAMLRERSIVGCRAIQSKKGNLALTAAASSLYGRSPRSIALCPNRRQFAFYRFGDIERWS
ncbi:MAG TPA: hypothetical protein VFW87_00325 [Pirellulales bacterium]|nr:hypothetical protein [Pirellulales bacterium]